MATVSRLVAASLALVFALPLAAQQYPAELLSGLHWRDVGPMRGGRTYGVAGNATPARHLLLRLRRRRRLEDRKRRPHLVPHLRREASPSAPSAPSPSLPPIPTSSTSAPASPTFAASTPTASACSSPPTPARPGHHIGLDDTRQIGTRRRRSCQPQSRLRRRSRPRLQTPTPIAASIAHSTAARPGRKFSFNAKDPDNVGAIDLAIDPKNPRVIYASLWATRRPPWSVYAPTNLPGGGLYKSTDGGDTWKQLTGGLPTDEFVGKIGIAVAPSNPNRLWAVVDDLGTGVARPHSAVELPLPTRRNPSGGVYLSDDAGATWKLVNTETPSLGPRLVLRVRSPSIPPTPTAPTSSTPPPT